MAMLDMTDFKSNREPIPFALDNEPPPTQFGNMGDPFIRSMTDKERGTFRYLRHRHGAATARRLVQFRRENPGVAFPRVVRRSYPVTAEKIFVDGWFIGLTSNDRVRIVLDGVVHDLTVSQAGEVGAALARIAA
jgi:hypothetical protein